jgi:thymidylate synthase (FAD)
MSKLVTPKTYFIGSTSMHFDELVQYLNDTDQQEFISEINQAKGEGLSDGEILCSFYAKMCYSALTTKKNKNISRVRGIYDNVLGTIQSGHGSVFEHCYLNFVVTDCSRIFTHELVRHRAGTSFSQTSGRYVRTDEIKLVFDPILGKVKDRFIKILNFLQTEYNEIEKEMDVENIKDFSTKKKLTSAMRRILPNGIANEIGFGVNLRALRHTISMRTSRHAEWEIRLVFNQVYELIKEKYPAILADAKLEMVEGFNEITFENQKI